MDLFCRNSPLFHSLARYALIHWTRGTKGNWIFLIQLHISSSVNPTKPDMSVYAPCAACLSMSYAYVGMLNWYVKFRMHNICCLLPVKNTEHPLPYCHFGMKILITAAIYLVKYGLRLLVSCYKRAERLAVLDFVVKFLGRHYGLFAYGARRAFART